MINVKSIDKKDNYLLQVLFSNGEIKMLDFDKLIKQNNQNEYYKKIAERQVFNEVKVGLPGEIYWENIATIKQLDGKAAPCNFDFSPEFVYANSK